MTELEHTSTVQRSITSENRHNTVHGSPMVCLNSTKINSPKLEQNIYLCLKQIESMHGRWLISLGQQEHAFLSSASHFIQITWLTYVFANIRRMPKWVQFVVCSLDIAI